MAGLFGLPVPFVAALGYAAVFGGATNTFLAPIIIGGEIFGFESIPYFFIVCTISYVFNANKSIYLQKANLHKGKLHATTVFDPYFRKNNAHFVFSSYLLYGGRADALPRLFGALKMAFPRIRRQSPV